MVARSAEKCRVVPSSAGKGWGRHWGAFKLLYYHCNTTKIDRVEQPRTVCGAEECRGMPSSSTTIEIPLKWKGSSSRGWLVVPRTAEWESSAGRGWGNTTTIERVRQPRADSYLQKRQRPRSAER